MRNGFSPLVDENREGQSYFFIQQRLPVLNPLSHYPNNKNSISVSFRFSLSYLVQIPNLPSNKSRNFSLSSPRLVAESPCNGRKQNTEIPLLFHVIQTDLVFIREKPLPASKLLFLFFVHNVASIDTVHMYGPDRLSPKMKQPNSHSIKYRKWGKRVFWAGTSFVQSGLDLQNLHYGWAQIQSPIVLESPTS